MFQRAMTLMGVLSACAGCANDAATSAAFTTAAVQPSAQTSATPGQLPRKSMADKVLAAIALERVTGLKPDPARLAEAN